MYKNLSAINGTLDATRFPLEFSWYSRVFSLICRSLHAASLARCIINRALLPQIRTSSFIIAMILPHARLITSATSRSRSGAAHYARSVNDIIIPEWVHADREWQSRERVKLLCTYMANSGFPHLCSRDEQNNPAKYPIYMPELCSRVCTRYSAKFVGKDISGSH